MRKFIKRLLIFVMIISAVTAAVNVVYIKHKGPDRLKIDKFESIPDAIQVCNFGSSHGFHGFDYENFEDDYNCFNFGLPSQRLSYDYRMFQYYGNHIAEGAVVFIPISYFSLFGIEEVSESDFLSRNVRYYRILPPSLIKEYDYKAYLFFGYLPALTANTGDLILSLLKKTTVANEASLRSVTTDIDDKTIQRAFDGHVGNKKKFYDADGNRIENQEEIDALYALVRGCQEKGAVPVLITTPFLHELTNAIKEKAPDFYDHFYSLIDRVVRDTGAEYYDYAFDERFASDHSRFFDTDHMNQEGARNFTDIVMREIVYAKGYYTEK